MTTSYAPRKLSFDHIVLVKWVLLALLMTRVNAHGWISNPPSRQEGCRAGTVDSQYCDNVQYEPQSIEALKGAPFTRSVGDHICNGGSDRFDALNTAGPGIWPNTTVQAGDDLTVQWKLTVAHKTTNYQYYLTKPSWSAGSTQRLTKDDFAQTPVALIDAGGSMPPLGFEHTIQSSAFDGRSGFAVLYAVWEIADTKNSFYNCVDLYIAGVTANATISAPTSTSLAATNSTEATSSATSVSTSTLANTSATSTTMATVASTTSALASTTTSAMLNVTADPASNSTANQTISGLFVGSLNATISGTLTNGTITNGTITNGTITNATITGTISGVTITEAERRRLARSVQRRRRNPSRALHAVFDT